MQANSKLSMPNNTAYLSVMRAIVVNQVARLAPRFYFHHTRETGRGPTAQQDSPEEVAAYLQQCFFEYFEKLDVPRADIPKWLNGKVVLEYGPGDILGVALLMKAHGAMRVLCADRFPLANLSEFNTKVIAALLRGLDSDMRHRADACFAVPGQPASGYDPVHIEYLIQAQGLSRLDGAVDLIVSRAVLEHVNDLDATLADMSRALRPGGVSVNLVDLRSHGMHVGNILDFLGWSPTLWHLMHSNKGAPNRIRIGSYKNIVAKLGFQKIKFETHFQTELDVVQSMRPQLAKPFRELADEELACLAFWMTVEKSVAA